MRNDAVLEVVLDLFHSVNYHGLAYAEVKHDSSDGYAIIEANVGRPTGHSAIAERGGVELLFTAHCDALGLPLPSSRRQRYLSVKWLYWRKDIQAALVRVHRRELTLTEWWQSVRDPSVEAIGSLRDPGPFAAEVLYAFVLTRDIRSRWKGLTSRRH